jgi:elongation of very long chain fatty acids protein 6
MNYCVHTVMYGYFALRAARIRLPRSFQQLITLLQLIQMIIGCIVNIAAFNYKEQRYSCATSYANIILSLIMYASYLILFAHFFYMNYLRKDSMKKSKDRTD